MTDSEKVAHTIAKACLKVSDGMWEPTIRQSLEIADEAIKAMKSEDDASVAAKVLADACVRATVESEGREKTRRERILHDIGSSCFNNLRSLQQDGGL